MNNNNCIFLPYIACDTVHFGKGCNETCHCKNNVVCQNDNGLCPDGGCEPGWTGPACNISMF